MKLLVLFAVAVAVMQLTSAMWVPNKAHEKKRLAVRELSRLLNKRAMVTSDSDSDLTSGSEEMDPSETIKAMLSEMFSEPSWRELVLTLADSEDFQDADFRAKWHITEADEQEKARENEETTSAEREKISQLVESGAMNAIVALSSTKEELMSEKYRKFYRLGDLTPEMKDAQEGGNFFESPQWYKFVDLSMLEIEEDAEDWQKSLHFMFWFMGIASMMGDLDE